MAKIIPLRRHKAIHVKTTSKHRVRLRVTDPHFPEETRWDVQRPVQNAVSHRLVSRFARQIEPYAARGQVEVKIDGKPVRLVKKLRA